MIGRALSHYKILGELGRGGMGEVYRAEDTKLKREVAIKVLPAAFSENEERLARFEREARLLASLNHPNIASIYGLEEAEGVKALVLELVQGPTLAERIAEGPIPLDEAIAIARQIADALEAAHEAGVIHRDLKPANIKIKEDGAVKVLDFGLAKALEGDAEGDASESPTMTAAATRAGVIMGTAAYMSPEQAKANRVDKRADVWAFGAVFFEMLTGKRTFAGDDVSDTLAAVLRDEPDWDALPVETPQAIRQVLRLCLTKDATHRMRDISDASRDGRGVRCAGDDARCFSLESSSLDSRRRAGSRVSRASPEKFEPRSGPSRDTSFRARSAVADRSELERFRGRDLTGRETSCLCGTRRESHRSLSATSRESRGVTPRRSSRGVRSCFFPGRSARSVLFWKRAADGLPSRRPIRAGF